MPRGILRKQYQDAGTSLLGWFTIRVWPLQVRLLLEEGVEVDRASNDASTALYVGAWKGHRDVVALLLSHGAAADQYHRERATPLFVAAQEVRETPRTHQIAVLQHAARGG